MVNLNELLDILATKPEEGAKTKEETAPLHPNVKKFINENEIESGEVFIPTYLVYYIYQTKWQPHGEKLNKIHFFREFNKVFKSQRTGRQRYYRLNNLGIHLKEEAKKYYDRYL